MHFYQDKNGHTYSKLLLNTYLAGLSVLKKG